MAGFKIKNHQQAEKVKTARVSRRANLNLTPNWADMVLEKRKLLASSENALFQWKNASARRQARAIMMNTGEPRCELHD